MQATKAGTAGESMLGLVVKAPWVDLITSGAKTWEIRGRPTNVRGPIALIRGGSGLVVGGCRVDDCLGPLDVHTFRRNVGRHHVTTDGLMYPKTYAWVLGRAAGDFAVAAYDGGRERLYTQQDANFNVTSLTDAVGAVQERYLYDPYGAVTYNTLAWGARGSSSYSWAYLHQGGRYDGTSKLYHFRDRDYSSTLGRWSRQDSLGYVDGSNLYEFGKSRPGVSLDPLGQRVIRDRNGHVKVWHAYDAMLAGIADKGASDNGAWWNATYSAVDDFLNGRLPETSDGAQCFSWDKNFRRGAGTRSPEPPDGWKKDTLAGLKAKNVNLTITEVNLNQKPMLAGQAALSNAITKIHNGNNNKNCECDIIVYVGHQPFAPPNGLKGRGIGFVPVTCFAKTALRNWNEDGFTGVTPDQVGGLMEDKRLDHAGLMKGALNALTILDRVVSDRIGNKKCDKVNIHWIWGSDTPKWQRD